MVVEGLATAVAVLQEKITGLEKELERYKQIATPLLVGGNPYGDTGLSPAPISTQVYANHSLSKEDREKLAELRIHVTAETVLVHDGQAIDHPVLIQVCQGGSFLDRLAMDRELNKRIYSRVDWEDSINPIPSDCTVGNSYGYLYLEATLGSTEDLVQQYGWLCRSTKKEEVQ